MEIYQCLIKFKHPVCELPYRESLNRWIDYSQPVCHQFARSRRLVVITNYTERTSSLGPESLFTRFSQTRATGWNRYLCRYYVVHYLVNFSGFRGPL